MSEIQAVNVNSNWKTLGDTDLQCILIKNSPDNVEIDTKDMKIDNCVCLVNMNGSEKSKAHLEIQVNGYIKNIALLSEAQIIEVFGVNDEYLLTHTAAFFDDWEDMAVYYSKISVPNIPVCKLKFSRTKNENRIWIYGVKVNIQRTMNCTQKTVHFNVEQINRLIGNSNFINLKNGNNLRNLLQFYFKHLPNDNLGYTLGKKSEENSNHDHSTSSRNSASSQESDVSDILAKMQVDVADFMESQKLQSKQMSDEALSNNWLKGYIDRKFFELKADILGEIDMKVKSLQEETSLKLDRIISLLESDRIKIQDDVKC